MRRRSARFSSSSALVGPGRMPSSRSALASQLVRHDSLIPKSVAICFRVVFGSRRRATATTSSRNSFG